MEDFSRLWLRTPYMPGQMAVRVGVDCARLVVAWCRKVRDDSQFVLPRRCQDAAFHDPRVVVECRRALVQAFNAVEVDPAAVQCGDIICVSRADNPFHVGIVSVNPLQIIHAEKKRSEVRITSLQALNCDGFKVREAYRLV